MPNESRFLSLNPQVSIPFLQSQLRPTNLKIELDLDFYLEMTYIESHIENWHSFTLSEIVSALCGDGRGIELA